MVVRRAWLPHTLPLPFYYFIVHILFEFRFLEFSYLLQKDLTLNNLGYFTAFNHCSISVGTKFGIQSEIL